AQGAAAVAPPGGRGAPAGPRRAAGRTLPPYDRARARARGWSGGPLEEGGPLFTSARGTRFRPSVRISPGTVAALEEHLASRACARLVRRGPCAAGTRPGLDPLRTSPSPCTPPPRAWWSRPRSQAQQAPGLAWGWPAPLVVLMESRRGRAR